MDDVLLTLNDLAEQTGIEARTIRSYIERGLLPGAQNRGRGATYTEDHLNRLRVIVQLKKARPGIPLNEIRILFQHMSPQQIADFAGGTIGATVTALREAIDEGEHPGALQTLGRIAPTEPSRSESAEEVDSTGAEGPAELTATERLVRAMRTVSGASAPVPSSKVQSWHRITVTEDVELAVRGEFSPRQVAAFREFADIFRHLLTRTDAITRDGGE